MLNKRQRPEQVIRRELKISAIFFAVGMAVLGVLLYFSGWLKGLPCEGLLCALLGGTILGGWCVCWRRMNALVYQGRVQPNISDAMVYYIALLLGGPVAFWPSVVWRLWKLHRLREPEDPWHTDSAK